MKVDNRLIFKLGNMQFNHDQLKIGNASKLNVIDTDKVFIVYNSKLNKYDFSKYVNSKYPFIHLIEINDTIGSVETLRLGIETILHNYNYNTKCLIVDCDTFYTQDIRNMNIIIGIMNILVIMIFVHFIVRVN